MADKCDNYSREYDVPYHVRVSIDCKIFVGGLGEEGTRIELEDSFQKFGPIKNIWLAKAPPSFAYIEMAVGY